MSKKNTWSRRNPFKYSRLDFSLISEELMSLVNKVEIKPGYRTDHSSVELELKLFDFTCGKVFWKSNNSLLYDKDFVEKVKKTIYSVIEKYALPVYNLQNIQNIPIYDLQFVLNGQQFFLTTLIRNKRHVYTICFKQKENATYLRNRTV